MTIGAYTFISKEWKHLQYPIDLWILWNSKFFDQLSIYSYGTFDFGIKLPSNVSVVNGDILENNLEKFSFYTHGLSKAMKALKTEWKVLLPSDEFIANRIDTSNLNRMLAYPLGYFQLYGNIETEIRGAFMRYSYRIHHGNKKVIADGGPRPPYSGKMHLDGFINLVQRRILKSHQKEYHPIWTATNIENWVYHTNCLRSPEIMSAKWFSQTKREVDSGIDRDNKVEWLSSILLRPFDYTRYKEYWPNSYLVKIKPPTILTENVDRFTNVKFELSEYVQT